MTAVPKSAQDNVRAPCLGISRFPPFSPRVLRIGSFGSLLVARVALVRDRRTIKGGKNVRRGVLWKENLCL